jgi:hypothetical protein
MVSSRDTIYKPRAFEAGGPGFKSQQARHNIFYAIVNLGRDELNLENLKP